MTTDRLFHIWAVYERPADYPDHFVVRQWTTDGTVAFADPDVYLADSLEQVRASFTQHACIHSRTMTPAWWRSMSDLGWTNGVRRLAGLADIHGSC
jgi:hypothetical protein